MKNVTNNLYAFDFETTPVPFFDRKGKKKLTCRGHPRFAEVLFPTVSDSIDSWAHEAGSNSLPPLDEIVFHNVSFDGLVGIQNKFWTLGDLWKKKPNCTALMAKVLRNDRPAALKELAKIILREDSATLYTNVDKSNRVEFIEYAKKDALYTAKLFKIFEDELNASFQWDLYRKVELPFSFVNLECELNGITVDLEKLSSIVSQNKRTIAILESEISPIKINFNSPKQVQKFLFGELNLPLAYLKGKVSSSKKALKSLVHPKVKEILKRNSIVSLLRELESIARFTDVDTGLIHPHINTLGADTGRCTSSNPNLQNISKDSAARELFLPRKAHKLIVLDFGQIEPRVLAHFLPAGPFRSMFDSSEDFYESLAANVFSNNATDVPGRAIAKQAILGVMYGLEAKTMAENLGCTSVEASDFLKKFDAYFPEVPVFKNAYLNQIRSQGYSEGLFNRRRYVENLESEDKFQRAAAEREAFNALIQGSAATIFKYKLVKLREHLPSSVRFLLHVHDEVILEAPEKMAEEILKVSKQLLEEPLEWFSVPLKVSGGVGSNWAQAKGV